MKLEHEHKDSYEETFFYMSYRISFSHYCCIEKYVVQVCISPLLQIGMQNRLLNDVRRETHTKLRTDLSSHLRMKCRETYKFLSLTQSICHLKVLVASNMMFL